MDIRKEFLNYFQSRGHTVNASSPLVPIDDDGTLMFVNAGMVPFKSIFTGDAPIPNPPRATSSQTCIRAGGKHNDLDNVGYTARHHTLFEMLGNFSFGDYFKKEVMAYSWEFITSEKYLNLPIDRLWVTVHENDDEAYELWQKHVSKDRIMKFNDKENFWAMGDTGACGPCSEIFYDQGAEHFSGKEDYMGGEGDRFLEIWNLVFMQYDRDTEGNLHPLPKPSIDTGMGYERVVAIKEGVLNNYHSSLFMPYIDKISEIVGTPYDYSASNSASYRVIADHLRSCSFLLAQGVNFDKDGRGYVLRRIMRRAIRHGYLLGLREPFMYRLVDTLVAVMGEQYDYLPKRAESIKTSMKLEEERFFRTIEDGIKLFNKELINIMKRKYAEEMLREHGTKVYFSNSDAELNIVLKSVLKRTPLYFKDEIFDGTIAFELNATYGFPLDLTQDMLKELGIKLDIKGYETKLEAQKAQSKANWKGTGDAMQTGDFKSIKESFGVNEFIGYEDNQAESTVLALLDETFKQVDSIDGKGWVYLHKTPFYAESGGQVGDSGELIIKNEKQKIKIINTKKFLDMNLSEVEGSLKVCDQVTAVVDSKRAEIEKHHSATHLLHAGLREILGEHIAQAGSLNNDKRLRFDFSHPQAMSAQEIAEVEAWVNDKISRNISRKTEVMSIDNAKKSGAMALFGEKYGDKVRVVSFENDSVELCGGTHVDSASQIGLFMITKESGVSAGVRRIEAICGDSAIREVNTLRDSLNNIKSELKNQNPIAGINRLKEQIKTLKKELQTALISTKKELTTSQINGITVIVDEVDIGDIKELIDEAKNKYPSVAIMLFQKKGKRVMIACGSKNTPINSGNWIKKIAPILGGGGGGRADFAQAGGKDASKINKAKERALEYLNNNL